MGAVQPSAPVHSHEVKIHQSGKYAGFVDGCLKGSMGAGASLAVRCNISERSASFCYALSKNRTISLQETKTTSPPDGCSGEPGAATDGAGTVAALKFRVAVLKHHRSVYRMSCALLRDEQEAEDVTQEAFLRYWERGGSVERPKEWLHKVAHNACLDRLRKSGRFVSDERAQAAEVREERDPAWYYQQGELSVRLRRLIDKLPEPQRSLIVLFDIQGMNGAECAKILDIDANQVKVYLHRARRRLRLGLEQSR